MQTVVITGGTDGLGKGLALHYLRQGARVIAVGSTPAKGEAFLTEAVEAVEAAQEAGAAGTNRAADTARTAEATGITEATETTETTETDRSTSRATFLRADLTSVRATRDLITTLEGLSPAVDKLILCAQRYRLFGPRTTTREGFEHSFALAYLSRFVLSHGLRRLLEAAPRPVIMNVGTPGVPLGRIHWDDPQLARHDRRDSRYSGTKATLQSFRANDLLGVAFAALYPHTPVRYIGYNPGIVSTGMPAHLPGPLRPLAKAAFAVCATSVAKAVTPMTGLLDDPPGDPFTAYRTKRRLALKGRAFDPDAALRLHHLTRDLLDAAVPGAA
ncbi:SDR family NAD(P)-dependent oxidoreductase [Streptomyces milbemycinicus]|uniref:SDR family NAD(P)-dependent oxidoreductase n=1 Tax=Streptomyces milbemycinicus TaxID=476552 RepID=A0ABW8LYX6_9ACTN